MKTLIEIAAEIRYDIVYPPIVYFVPFSVTGNVTYVNVKHLNFNNMCANLSIFAIICLTQSTLINQHHTVNLARN